MTTALTHFHLFVAHIAPAQEADYLAYAADDEGNDPPLLHDLGIHDFQVRGDEANYGMDVLVPDHRTRFTLAGLFDLSLLRAQDLPVVARFCDDHSIAPNTYITLYRRGLQLMSPVQLRFAGIHYVGAFEMDAQAREIEETVNPHLF